MIALPTPISAVTAAAHVAGSHMWSDEYKPTVARTASAREAAVAIRTEMEWESFAEDLDGDPIVYFGTLHFLTDVAMGRRDENRLIAWLASRMKVVWMCMTDGHEQDDGTRWFGDCWAGDPDDDPCVWEAWWTIDAEPRDFWQFTQMVART